MIKIKNKELKKPIFQGGMGVGVSLSGLAGAVAKAGGAGTISSTDWSSSILNLTKIRLGQIFAQSKVNLRRQEK